MYQQVLRCFPKEEYLIDIFEYIKHSTEDILEIHRDDTLNEEEGAKVIFKSNSSTCDDHPLESNYNTDWNVLIHWSVSCTVRVTHQVNIFANKLHYFPCKK